MEQINTAYGGGALAFHKIYWRVLMWKIVKDEYYRQNESEGIMPWEVGADSKHPSMALVKHFQAINACLANPRQRWRLKWPHFL